MLAVIVFVILLAWVLVPTAVGSHIGAEKGRAGAAWGFFLGWFGVLIVAVLPPSPEKEKLIAAQQASIYRECPNCKEQMRRDATVCPHCRMETDSWRQINGEWWSREEHGVYVFDEATRGWTKVGAATGPTSWEEVERLAVERADARAALVRPRADQPARSSKKIAVAIAVCVCAVLAIAVGAVLASRSNNSTGSQPSAQHLQYGVAYDTCEGKTLDQLTHVLDGSYVAISGLTPRQAILKIQRAEWIPTDIAISFAGCWDAYRHLAPRYTS